MSISISTYQNNILAIFFSYYLCITSINSNIVNFKDGKTNAMNVGTWLSNVRSSYKAEQKGKKPALIISSEEYQKLRNIGLRLGDDQDNRINNDDFQNNVIKLSNFKAEHGHVCIPPEHELYQWMSSMTELKKEGKLELNRSNVLDAIGVVWFNVMDGIMELVNVEEDHVIQDGTSLYNWVIDIWSKYKMSQLTTQDKNLVESFRIFSREDVKNVIERAKLENVEAPILNAISSSTIDIDDEDQHHVEVDEETEEMCLDSLKPPASTNDDNDFDTGSGNDFHDDSDDGNDDSNENSNDESNDESNNYSNKNSNDDDAFLQIGPPLDENNLVLLKRDHRYGFPKAKCHFCKRITTQCFCFGKLFASTPWAVIDNEKICGKPFCIQCAAEEENRTTCKDCFEYTTSNLDELDESRVKDLCNARGLSIGKKKMRGMKKLILEDQNKRLGKVDSASRKRKGQRVPV